MQYAQLLWSMDTLFTHFYTWKSHSTYGKPCPRVENGLIRSKNSTKYLNLGFHNSFSKLRYIWWNTGTSGNVFVHFHLWKTSFHWPQIPSIHGKAVFLWPPLPLYLTMTTNFLCSLQWNRVSTDFIWIVYQPWKSPFHWPQTSSTHGKWYFCDQQTALQPFPLQTAVTNFLYLYPLRW